MISGIILAAGESRRMNFPKALLSIQGHSFAEEIAQKIQQCGIESMILVTGAHDQEIQQALKHKINADFVWNKNYQQGQISSLQAGLRNVPSGTEGVLVWPVDVPLVQKQTITQLLTVFAETTSPLTIPTHNSKRGHPVIYGLSAMRSILSLTPDQTAKDLISIFAKDLALVETEDEGILIDIDSQEDYQKYVFR